MTWKTSYSSQSTINLGPFKGGNEVMFHLKELLKSVGFTVQSSSDGSTYNASGDQITHSGSGANGMANSNAWFRIQDPGALREYVFQRNTYTSWRGLYSASDKFTGGTPNATTPPTATDEVGLFKTLTTFQTMFDTATCYYNIVAQDTAHNGVYSWWLIGQVTNDGDSSPEATCIACEALDANYSSGDADPVLHFGHLETPTASQLTTTSASGQAGSFRGWMRYGEVDEEWSGVSLIYYSASSYSLSPYNSMMNPHNGKNVLLPPLAFRHSSTGTIVGFKGAMKHIKWNPTSYSYSFPTVMNDGTDNYIVAGDLAFQGFPVGVTPSV